MGTHLAPSGGLPRRARREAAGPAVWVNPVARHGVSGPTKLFIWRVVVPSHCWHRLQPAGQLPSDWRGVSLSCWECMPTCITGPGTLNALVSPTNNHNYTNAAATSTWKQPVIDEVGSWNCQRAHSPRQSVRCMHRAPCTGRGYTEAMEEIAVLLAQAGDVPTPEECSRFVSAIAAQLENNKGNFATVLKALGTVVGQVSQAHATKKYRSTVFDHLTCWCCCIAWQ